MNYELLMVVYIRNELRFYFATNNSLPNILSRSLWMEKHQALERVELWMKKG